MILNLNQSLMRPLIKEVAIISLTVVLVIGGLQLKNTFDVWSSSQATLKTGPSTAQTISKPRVGIDVVLQPSDLEIQAHKSTLLLIVSPTCRYCVDSIPYYHKLGKDAKRLGISLVVGVPDRANSTDFLKNAKLDGFQVKEWSALSFSTTGTPTLIFASEDNVVRRIWNGGLSLLRQQDVEKLMVEPRLLTASVRKRIATGERNITLTEFRELNQSKASGSILLDVRERTEYKAGHEQDAYNIPFEELYVRAPFELTAATPITVDCSRLSMHSYCQVTVDALSKLGLRTASVINAHGVHTNQCRLNTTE